jgi:hypothetical protein
LAKRPNHSHQPRFTWIGHLINFWIVIGSSFEIWGEFWSYDRNLRVSKRSTAAVDHSKGSGSFKNQSLYFELCYPVSG